MKKKLKTKKNELVFDVKQRELFLTGFSKRKRQRQRKAKEEIAVIIKKETKRIQEEAKNLKDKYKTSFRPIKELEESDESNEDDAEVYEFESNEVKVIVKSLETNKRLKKQEFVEEDVDMRQIKKPKSSFIKGMEMKGDDDEGSDDSVENEEKPEKLGFTGSKELKKLITKQTKTSMKKSEILQRLNDKNHKKNVKHSQRKKYYKDKFLKKHKKNK